MSRPVLLNSMICLVFCALMQLSACAPTGIYHTVLPGQTLYRISRAYGVEESRLASINQIKNPDQLRANQKIFIPGVTRLQNVEATAKTAPVKAPPVVPSAVGKKPKPVPETPKTSQVKPAPAKPAPAKPARQTALSKSQPVKGLFVWPVKGKLLQTFGKQNKNVYKGIEIGVPQGSAVLAAASGKVIYSGNGIPGYGNLVILEHSNSYFSVYGYNQKNLVSMSDYVGQGDKIALSGTPPGGQSARLHFEIRKGKSAVDPIFYLP